LYKFSLQSASCLCASGTIDLDISTCGTVSKSGSTITVSNVVVQNIGTAIATSNVLAYYLSEDITINNDDYLIGTDDLGALAVNATSTKSIVKDVSTITNPQIPAGTYYVGMLVYDSTFSEFNQNNNVCYDSSPKFTVTYGCKDITAYNYNPDETYTDNTTCQTCSVGSVGNGDANADGVLNILDAVNILDAYKISRCAVGLDGCD